jgi:molybdate transport system substrate-binding protein
LQTVAAVPEALAVGADYGLIVLEGAPPQAWKLALHILSPAGQAPLAGFGFEAPAQPQEQ